MPKREILFSWILSLTLFLSDGGDVSITAIKDAKLLKFAYSTNQDPQAASDFTSIGGDFRVRHRGSTCLSFPDLASAGLTAGQNVTLQMYWEAGPRNYPGYACADVTLVDDAADLDPINYTCSNSYLSTQTRGNANPKLTELRAAAEAEFNAEQGKAMADAIWKYGPTVSAPAAGGIGAGVTLVAVALVLLAGWATGAVAFGKRKAIALKQSTGSYPIQETKSISSSV